MNELFEKASELLRSKDLDGAVRLYEEAAMGGGDFLGTLLLELVPLYLSQGRLDRALSASAAATYFAPQNPYAWMAHSASLDRLGRTYEALACVYRALEAGGQDLPEIQETRLYFLSQILDPMSFRAAAEEWYRSLPPVQPASGPVATHSGNRAPRGAGTTPLTPRKGGRLKVGYVSADFRHHVMERYILALLEHHDREKVDLYCFDNTQKQDAISLKMRAAEGVTWKYIYSLSDEAVAAQIQREGIDILVDLSGITAGHRMGVFRRRPAPVQITAYGFLPTCGADCFDWRLGAWELQSHYSERIWRLPSSSAPALLAPELPVTPLPAERKGHITFGYVNGLKKLTDASVARFVEIVLAVPQSKLLVAAAGVACPEVAAMILRRFDPIQDRIILTELPQTPSSFGRIFSEIDIALDPLPYGGGFTSYETLWHGVPIITEASDRRLGSEAWEIQTEIGLGWAMGEGPIEMARKLSDVEQLGHLRRSLRDRLRPHYDTPAWVRSLEAAYAQMLLPDALAEAA